MRILITLTRDGSIHVGCVDVQVTTLNDWLVSNSINDECSIGIGHFSCKNEITIGNGNCKVIFDVRNRKSTLLLFRWQPIGTYNICVYSWQWTNVWGDIQRVVVLKYFGKQKYCLYWLWNVISVNSDNTVISPAKISPKILVGEIGNTHSHLLIALNGSTMTYLNLYCDYTYNGTIYILIHNILIFRNILPQFENKIMQLLGVTIIIRTNWNIIAVNTIYSDVNTYLIILG